MSGVTAAAGFRANGVAAGIKPSGELDVALVAAASAVPAAAVFTTSRTPAAPVTVSRERAATGLARAVLVNSGCPNAGTGEAGVAAALKTTAAVAAALNCSEAEILACSTGPIGVPLPVGVFTAAVPSLVGGLADDEDHARLAAEAIMTTDTVPKTSVAESSRFTVGGMAKGAGMLRPDLATMLAVLTTDAAAGHEALSRILSEAVAVTFNCLNVDGCQSTNDTVTLMASGASGFAPDEASLAAAVEQVCYDLTLQMAGDAEGATRVVHLEIGGARTDADARRLGRVVADSALVRSSFYGADPNWGRVFAALGTAGIPVDPAMIDISYTGTPVCRGGVAVPFDEQFLAGRLGGDFTVAVSVGRGDGRATIVTTDLTPDYVTLNAGRS